MAHAQKPDFVFRRNGRVHLNRRGRQFSQLLAAELCTSAVVMLDSPCSEVVWRVLATYSIRQFPFHFPSRASPCAITFKLESTVISGPVWKKTGLYKGHGLAYQYSSTLILTGKQLHWCQHCEPNSKYPQAVYAGIWPILLFVITAVTVVPPYDMIWYDMIWYMIYLLTASGLPLGGSSTVHIYTQTVHRTTQSKQYIEQHKNKQYIEQHKTNNT
jgi:hypothetical protein